MRSAVSLARHRHSLETPVVIGKRRLVGARHLYCNSRVTVNRKLPTAELVSVLLRTVLASSTTGTAVPGTVVRTTAVVASSTIHTS